MDSAVKYEGSCEPGIMASSDNVSSHNTAVKHEQSSNALSSNSPNVAYLPQQSVAAMQQLLSPLQFLQAPTATSGTSGASLSWMMPPPYQMMMLPGSGGVPQPLFLPSSGSGAGVFTMSDGQMFVAPLADNVGNGSSGLDGTGNTPGQNSQHHAGQVVYTGVSDTTTSSAQHRQMHSTPARRSASDGPRPPKKPLTPYMIFSKNIWPRIKAENAHLSSVCEIGAIVGSIWRELDATQKQQYNELYAKDKERYDEELRNYLKVTGLAASDLHKMKAKRSPSHHLANRSTPSRAPPRGAAASAAAAAAAQNQSAWTNGTALQQQSTALPALYADHDGSVSIDANCTAGLSAAAFSAQGGAAAASRSWNWQQQQSGIAPPSDGNNAGGMMVYQMPGAASDAASTSAAGEQSQYNGVSQVVGYAAAATGKPLKHFSATQGGGSGHDSGRLDQLEAEVERLRSALAEKTREAQQLQQDLSAARVVIQEQQQQQSAAAQKGVDELADTTSSGGAVAIGNVDNNTSGITTAAAVAANQDNAEISTEPKDV